MRTAFRLICTSLFAVTLAHMAAAEEILELNRSFIEKYKNRLTISATYLVDAAHKRPNPAKKDGDMHVAGRAAEIGLASVAQIQNAKDVPDAVQIIKDVEGTSRTVAMMGVWRIWPEHGGDNTHTQVNGPGSPFTGLPPTNPPHVFEIHPILQIGDQDLRGTLKPIDGFDPKQASDAFPRYEQAAFAIVPSGNRVQLRMRMIGYNYVQFLMKLRKRFERAEDGEFVSATILSPDDEELLVHDRRIGFVSGTAPDEKQRSLQVGQCMLVLGVPRVDLTLVSFRMRNASQRSGILTWSLPYEIIAVGIYDDQPRDCGND